MPLLRVVSRLAGGRASSSNGVVVVWLMLVLGCIFRHHLMAQTGDSGKGITARLQVGFVAFLLTYTAGLWRTGMWPIEAVPGKGPKNHHTHLLVVGLSRYGICLVC